MTHPPQQRAALLHEAVLRCNEAFIAQERYAAAIDEIADWLEAHPEGEQADEWLAFDQQQADEDEASLRREVFANVTNRLEERRNGLG